MLPFCLSFALLLILPSLIVPFADHSGLMALVGGCFLGYVAFVGDQATRSQSAWLARIAQANLLVFISWLAMGGGQMIVGQEIESCFFMLPLGLFLLATVCTLLEGVKRGRLQINLRQAIWWTAVFAVAAAMTPTIAPVEQQLPNSPIAAALMLVGVMFRLAVFSLFASFVAVPTLVVLDRGTARRNKLVGLVLICAAGAMLQVLVLGGLGLVTGSYVGSLHEIFVNGFCLDLGVMAVIVFSVLLIPLVRSRDWRKLRLIASST